MAITINDIKKLSPQAKALIVILIVFIVGYLYYFYFLSDTLTKKSELDKDYQDVQSQIKQKEKIALQFDKYKAEVDALKENYKVALLKLPDQREIPGLFHSVALAGRDAGIEFLLFEPKAAVPKILAKPDAGTPKISSMLKPSDQKPAEPPKTESQKPATTAAKSGDGKNAPAPEPFYEEIPVKVTVTGNFQNMVHFFEKVAKLPRIVNISDISMGDRREVKGRGHQITTSCTVKTYMFVDKKEQSSEKKNEKNKIIILCNLLIIFMTAFYAFCAEANKPSVQTPSLTSGTGQSQTQAPSLPQVLQTPDNAYSYNPLGKPDPFRPFVDVEITAVKKEKEVKTESVFPLQRVGVESFKLVGIAGDQVRRVAVVEDSAKKFYPLFIGTRIGLHSGKVTDILADRVTVDGLDGKKVKRIILKLHKNI